MRIQERIATSEPHGAEQTATQTEINIGGRTLPSRFFLAPLAGYTHLPLRTALREIGGIGLATTDLILAPQLLAGSKKSEHLLRTDDRDRPLSVQIFGGKVDDLVRAAQLLEARGFEGVDINMGCPMGKVNSYGGGARLMCDCDRAVGLVAAVVESVDLPVTVKMRLGWDSQNLTAPQLAREFELVGVAGITIHGRTRQQGFHGTVSLEGIRQVVAAVDQIPIIGNGDVRTVAEALHMQEFTGCAAVAIGRGAMLDPWLFRKLQQHQRGETPTEPTPAEQISFLVRHFELMAETRGDYACVLFRKFVGWYGCRLGIPDDLEDRLRRMETQTEFHEIVEQIEKRHGERESSVPTALIKTPNGPNERW